MRNIFFIFLFISNILFADNLLLQKQNTLYIQNLIQKEEQIAKAFEKYLLEEFDIPEMEDLQTSLYLGNNFSIKNNFGADLNLISGELKLNYAITNNSQDYIKLLYERDLYRDYTTVYFDTTTPANSFVEFKLKSKEAQNIFKILKSGKNIAIAKSCDNIVTGWCSLNKRIIKYYNNGDWIEYSKKDFTDGDVNVSSINIFNDNNIRNSIKIGAYIFVKNTATYIKFNSGLKKVE